MNRIKGWPGYLAWLLLCPAIVAALSPDRDQPIAIEANAVDIDERNDISIYSGDVRVTQGGMQLFADTLTLYGLREPNKIAAEGAPVRFQQHREDREQDVHGEAKRVEYHIPDEKLYLYDDARIWQGENSFGSDRIEYDVERELVRAGDRNDRAKRVKVLILPRQSDE